MHREISHTDTTFAPQRNLGLYALTSLLGIILAVDIALWFYAGRQEAPPIVFGFRLAIVAAVIGGARVLFTSLESLFEGRLGADLALAIACIASIYLREHLVAAEIVFIGLVGECLESITFDRTQRAIRKLVEVFPRRCWLLRDGQEVRVLTSDLQVGDRVVVKPGARVPVDGEVIEGRSAVDISALTGEAVPVDKGPGDAILAGSLNQFGALTIDAKRVAEHTVAGQVIEMTARALRDKAPLERTADRLARYFLPAVLGLAALTFGAAWLHFAAGWFGGFRLGFGEAFQKSLVPAITVLVVTCPCALILATPAAILAALGRLAGTGVLLKGGSALERLAEVTAFAFDKTGTLTVGRLELGDVTGLEGTSADELLRMAAAVEQRSEHLLARLIVREAQSRGLALDPVDEFQAHPGAGVSGRTPAGSILVGTGRLLEEQGIPLSVQATELLEALDAAGQTSLLVARDGMVLGAIGARDVVRPEAVEVLGQLAAAGIRDIVLLTGDRNAAAAPIAAALGITQVYAELLPQQKSELVARLRCQLSAGTDQAHRTGIGQRVTMVGDGINDAPALASADVGIAIGGTGADVAAEAGDIIMMGDPLRPLPLLVRLSRETLKIIRQNILIFAFGVNGFGVLVTAWLWPLVMTDEWWYNMGPLAGVIYHQIGSLAVLLNSMRLLWFERSLESPSVSRARSAIKGFDDWLQRRIDIDEGIHWVAHEWQRLLIGLSLLLVMVWAASGFTQVGPDETAVVLRFGRREKVLEPGLAYCWPWPIDRVVRLQAERIRTVQIGFRAEPSPESTGLTWDSPHTVEGREELAEQSLMVTGDNNLVELQATLSYRVDTARAGSLDQYLFDVRDVDNLVRAATESVLRSLVASHRLPDLLTDYREPLEREVVARLTKRFADYRLGIVVDGFALHDLHPPPMVVNSYYEVTKAMELRDMAINDANAKALIDVGQAESHYLSRAVKAEVAKAKEIYDAEVKWTEYLAWSDARQTLDFDTEWGLFRRALGAIQTGRSPAKAWDEYAATRHAKLAQQAAIIDYRLYWDRLTRALESRDVLLIDAEKAGGRRTLFLLDMDQFRLPVLTPAEAVRPQRSPFEPEKTKGPDRP
jgi:Cu+-exporting ATPase